MMSEPSLRISSLRSPTAFSRESDLSELLQTSSARKDDRWAGENTRGFISNSAVLTPLREACQAASNPASPPPTMTI